MDDEEGVRKLVGRLLRRMGHEVELAEDGQRAVEAYESAQGQGRPFDVVILDLTVRGGMGGQETIQALLKIDPAVKAIVMSGYAKIPWFWNLNATGSRAPWRNPLTLTNCRRSFPGSWGQRR